MMEGIKPALAVGQIWKDRSGWEIALGVGQKHSEGHDKRVSLRLENYTADGMHARSADETHTDHDLMSFVGWIDGYGPSAIEHKAVSATFGGETYQCESVDLSGVKTGEVATAQPNPERHICVSCTIAPASAERVKIDGKLYCPVCAHARDGLTATDRRLLNERIARQKKRFDDAQKAAEMARALQIVENSVTATRSKSNPTGNFTNVLSAKYFEAIGHGK